MFQWEGGGELGVVFQMGEAPHGGIGCGGRGLEKNRN